MPTFPGSEKPEFVSTADIPDDGFRELNLKLNSHSGTHIDAPAHILVNGKTLSDLPLSAFTGTGLIIKLPIKQPLTNSFLQNLLADKNLPDFVLFQTDWSANWNTPDYFKDFPVPENQLLKQLVSLGIKGVGIDAPSVDPIDSHELPNHHTLLGNNILIIENLTNLYLLSDKIFTFNCFPLNIFEGDASPVRAFAVL